MARGKHAVRAAKHRVEASHEIIDRLTSDLAEAKVRYKLVEDKARRYDAAVKENEALRQQIANNTSARLLELEETEQELRQRLREQAFVVTAIKEQWRDVANQVFDLLGGTPTEKMEKFAALLSQSEEGGLTVVEDGPVRKGLDTTAVRRVQMARGQRSTLGNPDGTTVARTDPPLTMDEEHETYPQAFAQAFLKEEPFLIHRSEEQA